MVIKNDKYEIELNWDELMLLHLNDSAELLKFVGHLREETHTIGFTQPEIKTQININEPGNNVQTERGTAAGTN